MGNFIDLTGKRFGRLTVIRQAAYKKPKRLWECICDCGNKVIVPGGYLRDGNTRSCGCLREELRRRIRNDLTGKRFGRLVVQHLSDKKRTKGTFWHCLCDCGNEVDVNASSLQNGSTKSCGCLAIEKQRAVGAASKGRPNKRFIDLTGQRFGRYVVLRRAENTPSGGTRWVCRCDCGNERIVTAAHLRSGHSKSCGCLGLEHATQAKIKHGKSNTPLYRVFLSMHNRCELKTVKEYRWYGGKGVKVCSEWKNFEHFYEWSMKNGYIKGLEIDRIDHNKGYCPENCRWITSSENISRAHYKHGGAGTPLYARYRKLVKALGTELLCDEWKDFPSFKAWSDAVGLTEGFSLCLVKKDESKPLSADNFELITKSEQLARRNRARAKKGCR